MKNINNIVSHTCCENNIRCDKLINYVSHKKNGTMANKTRDSQSEPLVAGVVLYFSRPCALMMQICCNNIAKKTVSSTDGTIKFLAVIFANFFPKLTPN